MRMLAGDTWGISGPTFIWAYIVLVVVALAAVIVIRRVVRIGRAPATDEVQRLETSPIDVAYLNGGGDLAIVAAYSALHTVGALTTASGGTLAIAPVDVPPDLPRLVRTVYEAASHGVHHAKIAQQEAVAAELVAIRDRLVHAGLLMSAARRGLARGIWLIMPLVLVFGFVRLGAGIAGHKPIGYLVLCLIGCLVATINSRDRNSRARQTRAGRRILGQLRVRCKELDPSWYPSWTSYGPAAAALGVGVFGADALWMADPQFARQLAPLTGHFRGAATMPGPAGGTGSEPGVSYRTGTGFGGGVGLGGNVGTGGGGGFGGGGGCGG